jgi:hypothetical protein
MRIKLLVLISMLLWAAAPGFAAHHEGEPDMHHTQSGEGSDGATPLEASFEPTPEPGMYTTNYYFGMTRGLADSTLHPALQLPLFLVTLPLDIVLLPVAAVMGFF